MAPAVLREIKSVKQEPGIGRRRWFESEAFDVVIWFDGADEVIGFQLCYDLGRGEHALTWRRDGGFVHSVVDAGDEASFGKLTPVLEPASEPVPWSELLAMFDARSDPLEPELRGLLRARLAGGAVRA